MMPTRKPRHQEASTQRLKVGDCVREVDGEAIGVIVHVMECGLTVVNFPPSREGFAYHPGDLSDFFGALAALPLPPLKLPFDGFAHEIHALFIGPGTGARRRFGFPCRKGCPSKLSSRACRQDRQGRTRAGGVGPFRHPH
jgi:hypothetical protein